MNPDLSIWEEMLSVFAELRQQEQTLRTLEKQMSDPNIIQNETEYEKDLKGL